MSRALKFELVLPCYNESKSLEPLVQRVIASAEQFSLTPEDFQLILVENGSTDDSVAVMEKLKLTVLGKWFRIVRVPYNQGYGFGLWTGLQATSAPVVGWSHADQQCDPKDAIKAFQMVSGAGVPTLVKGVRLGRNKKDIFVSRVFELMSALILGLFVKEMNAQPKVFPRYLLSKMTSPPQTFAFDLYTLYHAQKANFSLQTIQVYFPPRIHGASKWAATLFSRYKTILGMIRYMWRLARNEGRL